MNLFVLVAISSVPCNSLIYAAVPSVQLVHHILSLVHLLITLKFFLSGPTSSSILLIQSSNIFLTQFSHLILLHASLCTSDTYWDIFFWLQTGPITKWRQWQWGNIYPIGFILAYVYSFDVTMSCFLSRKLVIDKWEPNKQ
jgi:hypothetical protein